MMPENPSESARAPADLLRLKGKTVLVRSTRDQRTPPSALRGSIEVHETEGAAPTVSIALEFPQMFTSRAHHRNIPLDRAALERLVASERNGAFEFTIDDELR